MSLDHGSDDLTCIHCGVVGCIVDSPEGRAILAMAEEMRESGQPNRKIRFACYRAFSHEIHGVLGKGKRQQLPHCVTVSVRDDFPVVNEKESYTGFKESSGN